MSQFILSTKMRQKIFQDALRQQLDRIIADQVDTPELAEAHKQLNMKYAALYRHWAKAGPEAEIAGLSATTLLNEGWSGSEIQELKDMAVLNGPSNLLSRSRTEELLDELNVAVTSTTVRQASQIIFDARSRACVLATELAGQVMPFGGEWAAEAVPSGGGFGYTISPPSGAAQGASQDRVDQKGSDPVRSTPSPAKAPPEQQTPQTNLAEALVAWTLTWSDQAQDKATLDQYGASVRLLIFLVGNIPLASLDEDQMASFIKKTMRLRPNYRLGSKKDIMLPEKSTEEGGLTRETLRRHVTGIKKFLDWARKHYKLSGKIDFSGLVPAGTDVRARDKTLSWTDDDCAYILTMPPFTGCSGTDAQWGAKAVHQRLIPGPNVYHDAWYWAVLLLCYTGARREEICKLLVSDVGIEQGIAFIWIRYTITGRLKNLQSVRKIPLHRELIRLGFLEFVEARKSIAHLAVNNLGKSDHELFPDLRPTKGKDYGSMFYRDIWIRLVAAAFSNPGDENIHSFRHGFENFLDATGCTEKEGNDLFGHETKSSTRRKVYGDPTPLPRLAQVMELRAPISCMLVKQPVTLTTHTSMPPFVVQYTPRSKEPKKLTKSRRSSDDQ